MPGLTAFAASVMRVQQSKLINKVAWNTATEDEMVIFEGAVRDSKDFQPAVTAWKMFYEKCCWGREAQAAATRLGVALRRCNETLGRAKPQKPQNPASIAVEQLPREGPIPIFLTNEDKQEALLNPEGLHSRYAEPFLDYLQRNCELEHAKDSTAHVSAGARVPSQAAVALNDRQGGSPRPSHGSPNRDATLSKGGSPRAGSSRRSTTNLGQINGSRTRK